MNLARIEGEEIVIRVPVEALPNACATAWDKHVGLDGEMFKVADLKAFAGEFVRLLNRESEDGTTIVHLMLDKAAVDALEDGADGLTWSGDK